MPDRWNVSLLLREAVSNTFAKGARLLPAVALAGLFGAGCVAFMTVEQSALRSDVAALSAQGMGVVIYQEVTAERPALIQRESCESLASTPGVEASGLVVSLPRLDALPIAVDAPAQRASVSLFPSLGRFDVLVGGTLARYAGDFRVLVDRQVLKAAVAPPARAGLATAYSLTFPLLPGDTEATRCVVVLDPLARAPGVIPAQIAQLDVRGNPITAQEVLTPTTDPVTAYLARGGRFLPSALGVLGGVITGLLAHMRTSELAAYRLSGSSRMSLLTLTTFEGLLLGGVAAAASSLTALILSPLLFDPTTAIANGIVLAGTWAVVGSIATIDLAFRSPIDLAKDR